MNARDRLVIVIEYECGSDREQAMFEAMTQIRTGERRLNKNHVKVVHIHAAIKNTASQVIAIFNQVEGGAKMTYHMKAKALIVDHFNARVEKTDDVILTLDDVYVVWFSKTLQNWKALVSTTIPDGMYYEITYNGDKGETYIDAYKKFENIVIPD